VNHLVWRLHRNQAYLAVAALAALTVILVITGITMADDYRNALANCAATQSCGDLGGILFRGDGAIMDLVDFTLFVPLLFGLFWGAPLLAKEFEDGTHNLAWTQGVSRWRWMRANIGWSLLAAAVWGAALAALVSWWRYPENALSSRFNAFDVQGIVPVAYALFAVALGIAVGSVIRRVLPSLAVTLAIFVAIRVAIGVYLRPHYMAPVTKVFPLLGNDTGPSGSWVLSQGLVSPTGKPRGRPGRTTTRRRQELPRSVPGVARLPPDHHLPARQPILGLPGLGGRHLRRLGCGPRGLRHLVGARSRRVS
jgi:ABC-type transport system involved in multi-copper enzyme maturation permease subunit